MKLNKIEINVCIYNCIVSEKYTFEINIKFGLVWVNTI